MSARMYWLQVVSVVFSLHVVCSGIPGRIDLTEQVEQRKDTDGHTSEVRKERSPRLNTFDTTLYTPAMKVMKGRRAKRSELMEIHDLEVDDMKLSPGQFERLYRGVRGRAGGGTAGVPWTDGIIPYQIETSDYTSDQILWIKRAMKNWEDVTCVRFRPAVPSDVNKLKIHSGDGCTSALGMAGGEQLLSLAHGCFSMAIVEHELGHALGLIHEHQREQRDGYIKVDYFKMEPKWAWTMMKFAQGGDDKMGVEYDYESVMHYHKVAYAADGMTQTIYPRDPTKTYVIGMVVKPSFLDAKVVSLIYRCGDKCRGYRPMCADGCFLSADCKCVCKEDVPKEVCEDKDPRCPAKAYGDGCMTMDVSFMETYCRKSCHLCNADGSPPHPPCEDRSIHCPGYASYGECEANPGYMLQACRVSCGECTVGEEVFPSGPCRDKLSSCRQLAARGECDRNPGKMLKDCTKSCDFCPEDLGKTPTVDGCVDYDTVCRFRADNGWCQKFYALMTTVDCRHACGNCNNTVTLPAGCVDDYWQCPGWAYGGECEANPNMMLYGCQLSCSSCPGLKVPGK